jgi:hypothetical protein
MTTIVGAGLAGLIAGSIFPRAQLFEAGDESQSIHKAVLRFRTSAVGDATGVEFKKVNVKKGLWYENKFVQPDIRLANWYSGKVVGKLADRSIWNLDPVERFIAPEDLISQLVDRCSGRISWNTKMDEIPRGAISTVPMPIMAKLMGIEHNQEFKHAPIHVERWHIPGADVYQTIYYPDLELNVYRASITKDLLIIEAIDVLNQNDIDVVFKSFGINSAACSAFDKVSQRYGKISAIDEGFRRNFIYRLTQDYGIYSLGRFATWRNILLDDVVKDAQVIKRIMKSDNYDSVKVFSK